MIYQESRLNPLPSGRYFSDFRSMVKFMAGKVRDRHEVKRYDRRFFIRKVTERVADGNPTLAELTWWYGMAMEILHGEAL